MVIGQCYAIAMFNLTHVNQFNLTINYVKHVAQSSHMYELNLGACSHVLIYLLSKILGYSGIVTCDAYYF